MEHSEEMTCSQFYAQTCIIPKIKLIHPIFWDHENDCTFWAKNWSEFDVFFRICVKCALESAQWRLCYNGKYATSHCCTGHFSPPEPQIRADALEFRKVKRWQSGAEEGVIVTFVASLTPPEPQLPHKTCTYRPFIICPICMRESAFHQGFKAGHHFWKTLRGTCDTRDKWSDTTWQRHRHLGNT